MSDSLSERRLAENEVLFRQNNEQVASSLEALKNAAESEGYDSLVPDMDMPLHFYCECSDEKCHQRILLTPSAYKELHQNKSQFMVLPGHTVPAYERIVRRTDNYVIVEKHKTPPRIAHKLNPSDLDHS